MKQELPNLSQLIKTKDQKEFLIKIILVGFLALVISLALFFELQFRKTKTLEGVIQECRYEGADMACSYLQTSDGNFLLTQGTIAKAKQVQPTISIYDTKVRLIGRISRQKLAIKDLGEMNRFQIEKLEFLE